MLEFIMSSVFCPAAAPSSLPRAPGFGLPLELLWAGSSAALSYEPPLDRLPCLAGLFSADHCIFNSALS